MTTALARRTRHQEKLDKIILYGRYKTTSMFPFAARVRCLIGTLGVYRK